jgi:hypothetical protein
MKTRDGFMPSYNLQIASDSEHHFIVDEYVTNSENDMSLLGNTVENITENLDLKVEKICADSGYYDAEQIQDIEEKTGTECFVSILGNRKNNGISFTYDKDEDVFRCSEGKKLVRIGNPYLKRNKMVVNYFGKECQGCPLMSQCTDSKEGKGITGYVNQSFRESFKEKMQTPEAIEILKGRKSKIEHINGTIKLWAGKIPIYRRGIEKVASELSLYCLTYNFKRLMNLLSFDELMQLLDQYALKYNLKS